MTIWKKNMILSSAFILTMTAMLVTTLKSNRKAMTYPYVLMAFVVFFSLVLLIQSILKNRQTVDQDPPEKLIRKALILIVICCAFMLGYILSISLLGYLLSTFLFMLVVMLYLKEKKWFVLLLVPAGLAGFLYALFNMVLKVSLPAGSLFGG